MLKHNTLTIAILTGLGFLPLANAADEFLDKRWYIAPFGSFVRTEGGHNTADGWGGGLGIGKTLNEHFNVEVKGFYQAFGSYKPSGHYIGDWQLGGGTVDAQYFFNRNKFAPYTVVGLGAMMRHLPSGSEAKGFIAELGAGFTYEVSDNFLLRSDVRYRYNNNPSASSSSGLDQFHDVVVNFGFVIPLGAKPTQIAQVAPPIVSAPPVPDCRTLDADGDGVNNCQDSCPNTPASSKVDDAGCPIRLILKNEHFNFDSAELTFKARQLLDEVATSLNLYPQKNAIEVQGHASSEGSDTHNMKLSQRRAESVVSYLKGKGVSNKLRAIGFGESRPVADNSTEGGRSANRRVELIWIDN
ncbi:OmpA family protein [Methylovulum psychrotolerans]|uniref:OmpA family protein n=1 Tax=Methylovulum psychrotolerans TaxID=1704499 RepID=UPI001BFF324A|nr:OmpA family protein [Methylovulum psychrotolerans]MBT9099526.1 OmpA family protein [Methylovulum psychrotolerans]